MNVLLLSAGEATRLRPLSLGMPKCLFPLFGNEPILKYWIDALTSVVVDKIYIDVFWLKYRVIDYLQSLKLKNVVWYEEDYLEPVGEVLSKLKDSLGEKFLIVNSDTYIGEDQVRRFIIKTKVDSNKSICLAIEKRKNVLGKGKVILSPDRCTVFDFVEKPIIDEPGYVWAGMTLMDREVIHSYSTKELIQKEPSDIFFDFKRRMSVLNVDHVYDIGDSLRTYCKTYLRLNKDSNSD